MKIALSGKQEGFTLLEIMVVVIILGIIAATIVPQFIGQTQQAKENTAKATVAELEQAVERFNLNMDRHPTTDEGLKVLVDPPTGQEKNWRGPYMQSDSVPKDPWGNDYIYECPGRHGSNPYDLSSSGAPGTDKVIANWTIQKR